MPSGEEKKEMEDPNKKKAMSLPSNYVTLQQLQEQRLKEQQKKREEEEDRGRQLQKQREKEGRERQLPEQREKAAAAAKEREKQLQTLGSNSRECGGNRRMKDEIPAIGSENNGQEPTIETKKKKKKQKQKKHQQPKMKPRPKKNQALDGGAKESEESESCKTTEIPLLTAAISQKIEVLNVSDCEKKGELEMKGVGRSDKKSTVKKRGDSRRDQGFEWRWRPLREREGIKGSDEPLERSTTEMRRGSRGARAVPVRDLWIVESGKLLKINGSDRVGERSSSENGGDCEKRGEMEGSDGLGEKSTAENGVTRDCEKMEKMDAGAVEISKSRGRGSFRRRGVGGRENRIRRMPVSYWGKRWEMNGSDGVERRSTADKRHSFRRKRGMEGRFPVDLMWVKKDVTSDGVSHFGSH